MVNRPSTLKGKIERITLGQEKPGLLLLPLLLAQAIYSLGARGKNFLYNIGALKPSTAPGKVVCVGALTVGGAGKTPFVELVVNKLTGRKPGILSRGYKGKFKTKVHVVSDGVTLGEPPPVSADEPYMLAKKLSGVPVVCAPARIDGAKVLANRFGVEVVVMDDGYGHRALDRDLNILLLSASSPFGAVGKLLPLGALREPEKEIVRADIIVFTSQAPISDEKFGELLRLVEPYKKEEVPCICASSHITRFTSFGGKSEDRPVGMLLAVTGIARPERVIGALKNMGLHVEGEAFPDHHMFTRDEIELLNKKAESLKAQNIVTTAKDAVRLIDFEDLFSVPLLVAQYETTITRGEEKLDQMLANL